MTIEKGEPWGTTGALPVGAPVVDSDQSLRACWEPALLAGEHLPIVGLVGGDLARTCGSPGSRDRLGTDEARRLPVDVVEVIADGVRYAAVAHVILRRSWWRGRLVAAMNAQFLGAWDVAPRGHPNDGRLDLLDADLSLDDRLKARTRLRSGTHVPHPGIAQRRVREATIDLDRTLDVWIDGIKVTTARTVDLRVHPDAGTIHI